MNQEATEQYLSALKAGQKYYKEAVAKGKPPYPAVLDEIIGDQSLNQVDLGLTEIPAELIVGTRSAGRTAALAGNFMPLLDLGSEFATKWVSLCASHLAEGIRDPIMAYEYLGRFYVQEGNKRVSVLKSFGAPTVSGRVIRLMPPKSDDEKTKLYEEFVWFNGLTGLWNVQMTKCGSYRKLLAALGMEEDHVWTQDEQRSFRAAFTRFSSALEKLGGGKPELSAGEALLVWLQLYPFAELKNLSAQELQQKLKSLWPDVLARTEEQPITVSTLPEEKEKGVLSKILDKVAGPGVLKIAFLYAYPPESSPWTRAHDFGRAQLEESLGDKISVKTYLAQKHDYDGAFDEAIADGAELIFATVPGMIGACRKAAAKHKNLKILNCGLFQPYTGVRMYYSRLYESKFITGAIAGVMSDSDLVGYVANYPIYGVPAAINAFALGLRMTRPGAKVRVEWSCTKGDPVKALLEAGCSVISNREAVLPGDTRRALSLGTYRMCPDGQLQPLAMPRWAWGKLYEKIVRSVLSGAWDTAAKTEAVNYWWGMDSGALDVELSEQLPEGVRGLGEILKRELAAGTLHPFRIPIRDQNGLVRNDGSRDLSPEEIMGMDWLCENVEGEIPPFEDLLPASREMTRLLGVYRDSLPPEKEEPQL